MYLILYQTWLTKNRITRLQLTKKTINCSCIVSVVQDVVDLAHFALYQLHLLFLWRCVCVVLFTGGASGDQAAHLLRASFEIRLIHEGFVCCELAVVLLFGVWVAALEGRHGTASWLEPGGFVRGQIGRAQFYALILKRLFRNLRKQSAIGWSLSTPIFIVEITGALEMLLHFFYVVGAHAPVSMIVV